MDVQKATQDYRMNEWIRLIRECNASGLNVTTWCKNNDIRPNKYYYWLRKIRIAACKAHPSMTSNEEFVPVNINSESNSTSLNTAYVSSETSQADVTIRIRNAVIEINNNASVNLIENVIRSLQNVR